MMEASILFLPIVLLETSLHLSGFVTREGETDILGWSYVHVHVQCLMDIL